MKLLPVAVVREFPWYVV